MRFLSLSNDQLMQDAQCFNDNCTADESESDYSTDDDDSYSDSDYSTSDSDDDDNLSICLGQLTLPRKHGIPSEAQRLGLSSDAIVGILKRTKATPTDERMHESAAAAFVLPSSGNKDKPGSGAARKPEECLKKVLAGRAASRNKVFSSEGPYLRVCDQDVKGYGEVAMATRKEDIVTLRQLLQNGVSLQSCNRHGESVVHIACRRSSLPILKILMKEAKVSIRLRDDMGKTPLHDAAWTTTPSFEVVKMLLEDSPDLLFARDKRGHSALDYVPQTVWPEWCEFLESNKDLIQTAVKSPYTVSRSM
jgi:hypothetical protein